MLHATATATTIARAALVLVLVALLAKGVDMHALWDWLKGIDPNAVAAMILAATAYVHNHRFRKQLAASSSAAPPAPPAPPPARPQEYPAIPTR